MEFGKLKIEVWDLGKLELGIIVKITCLRGLVFLAMFVASFSSIFLCANREWWWFEVGLA